MIARLVAFCLIFVVVLNLDTLAQRRSTRIADRSHPPVTLSPEAREIVDLASVAICKERIADPKASVPIDDMQGRPSLPVRSPEAIAGAKRAQRLLPVAKSFVIAALRRLAREYSLTRTANQRIRIHRAVARISAVRYIRPDMDARDNASVFLHNPRTIVFGTIFLAGLPSDEGIISVLSHELLHIGDGGEDSLRYLFQAVGERASRFTGLKIQHQRAEELTCDLVGIRAARGFVSANPNYEPLPRRISRSLAHNCVTEDEGDDDHLSPRTTIRAVLMLSPALSRELVFTQ